MGSKKPRRKKMKCKRFLKLQKTRSVSLKKNEKSRFSKGLVDEENLPEKNRSLDYKKYSHFYICEKFISRIKHFSQVREHYFSCLQNAVIDNCKYYEGNVSNEMLENVSLELEQDAILVCLQASIYKKSMAKIIGEIKKSTEEKQINAELKRLIPEPCTKDKLSHTNPTQSSENETYYQIPIISSTRTDKSLNLNENSWTEHAVYSTEGSFLYPPLSETPYQDAFQTWSNNENCFTQTDFSNYWNGEVVNTNESMSRDHENNYLGSQPLNTIQVIDNYKNHETTKFVGFSDTSTNQKPFDPLSTSRTQLQKSIEKTLSQSQILNKEKRDEKQRAYIAHILEGEDSLDDKFYDSFSDNENEAKENVDESNLMDRLEKMRELFGMEEEGLPQKNLPTEKNQGTRGVHPYYRRPSGWRHEKVIQLYKFSKLSSEMSFQRAERNRNLLREIFGEDSDEENAPEYCSEEKYRLSCIERISSWVVKHLMPFYNSKKIIGRNVFKCLGQYISESIVDKIQYPDEWTVKYFVSKFFPPRKIYLCEADVLAFQFDQI